MKARKNKARHLREHSLHRVTTDRKGERGIVSVSAHRGAPSMDAEVRRLSPDETGDLVAEYYAQLGRVLGKNSKLYIEKLSYKKAML